MLKNSFANTFNLCRVNVYKFLLLLRKDVYPYEYMSDVCKFNEKELPNIDNVHCKLNSSCISKEDYLHANKVWKFFKIKDMGKYHDLYVRSDVAQLSGVF